MNNSKKAIKILDILRREFVGAETALHFRNPLELLIATILSAQCTDVRVNKVTPTLFSRFKAAKDYAGADQGEIEELIKSTGFYRNKAKAIKGCCGKIVSSFAGEVPNSIEDLTSLMGVGRKTANIVLSIAFGQDAVAVDTHVKRLSMRIGFTKNSNPDRIEIDLQNTIPQKYWTETTKLLIFHGRHICTARKPKCEVCLISGYCDYFSSDKLMGGQD